MSPQDLTPWIGRTEEASGNVPPFAARAMAASLDLATAPGAGDPLPALWHWLMPPEPQPAAQLGPDGHSAKGGFLPPVPLPRRMWAGGRLRFHAPLPVGAPLHRRSTVSDITQKTGRSGPLCFVTVTHVYSCNGVPALDETHDIVYRAMPSGPAPTPPPAPDAPVARRETIHPDSTLLFRYSALTFNGHKIHYDLDHCRKVEGYPGLIVHGPLIATLLADLAQRLLDRPLGSFAFRATQPLFHDQPFQIEGHARDGTAQVRALTPQGALAMTAEGA